MTPEEILKKYKEKNEELDKEAKLQSEINNLVASSSQSVFTALEYTIKKRKFLENTKNINEQILKKEKERLKILHAQKEITDEEYENKLKELNNLSKQIELEKELYKRVGLRHLMTKGLTNLSLSLISNFKDTASTLLSIDSSIRQANINLGISDINSKNIRDNFNQSLMYATAYGAKAEELSSALQHISETTGTIARLSNNDFKFLTQIGKGTGLGIEGAGQLAGQFMLIGKNAKETRNFVEETVDLSERMGVNAKSVLDSINKNFRIAQRYGFKEGVKGLAKMTAHSEKFRINMDEVFASAEKARTLEGAIEMAANLQVMGGQFANFDPLRMLHLARNDMEQYNKEMAKMLEGVAQFDQKKGQIIVGPADIDRLKFVAEATGQSLDSLRETAVRSKEISMIRQKTPSFMNEEERQIIEKMAKLDSKTGLFKIDGLGDISKLTKEQVKQLRTEQKTLEQRMKEAATFDEQFQNTIMSLKVALLPILNILNDALSGFNDMFGLSEKDAGGTGVAKNLAKAIGIGILGVLSTGLFSMIPKLFTSTLKLGGKLVAGMSKSIFGSIGKILRGGGGKAGGFVPESVSKANTSPGSPGSKPNSPLASGESTGKFADGINKVPDAKTLYSKAAGIAAIGVAAAGIGAGIFMATKGITGLVESFKGMTDEEMTASLKATGIVIVGFGATIVGLALLSPLMAKASLGLLAMGAAALALGGGIYLATNGISGLVDSLARSGDIDAGGQLMKIAGGLAMISGSGVGLSLAIPGLLTMSNLLSNIPDGASFDNMADAFYNAKEFANSKSSNIKDMIEMVDLINSSEMSNFSKISDALTNLKVSFDEQKVNLVVNLTSEIDGKEIAKNTTTKVLKVISSNYDGKSGFA